MNMKTIWKYELNPLLTELEVPKDSKILSLQTQFGIPCIWLLVEPNNDKSKLKLTVVGTGHNLCDENKTYIGTFQMDGGELVLHVFSDDK